MKGYFNFLAGRALSFPKVIYIFWSYFIKAFRAFPLWGLLLMIGGIKDMNTLLRLITCVGCLGIAGFTLQAQDAEKEKGEVKREAIEPDGFEESDFQQPEIEELPANDAKAQADLKAAYDAIYFAASKGLEKMAANASISLDVSKQNKNPLLQGLKLDAKLAWTAEKGMRMELVEDEAQTNPLIAQIRQTARSQIEQIEEMLIFLIGFQSFEDNFEDVVFVYEEADAEKRDTEESFQIRAWKQNDGSFSSTLYTLQDGKIINRSTKDTDQSFEFEQSGRDFFFHVIKKNTRLALEGIDEDMKKAGVSDSLAVAATYTIENREKINSYTIGTKLKIEFDVGKAFGNLIFELKEVKTNDDVTDELLEAVGDDTASSTQKF